MLPDEVLLVIFGFCAAPAVEQNTKRGIEAWQSLVHVCRRWRSIVFGSPRHLNLRLVSTEKTFVRDTLDVWPPLPLVIWANLNRIQGLTAFGVDSTIEILKHRDRVDDIHFRPDDSDISSLEEILAAMQVPFPELTNLQLWSRFETVRVVPDSFLGGSAPRLESLKLRGIPFPGLPNLLRSATRIVDLQLSDIPHSGYFSPDTLVTALSTLTSLQTLVLQFRSPRSHPDPAIRRLLLSTRAVLPVLTGFSFKGACEYLDDFVGRIDTPRIHELTVTFFNDIVFDAPQFIQFIDRIPMLKQFDKAHVIFGKDAASVNFPSFLTSVDSNGSVRSLIVEVSCSDLDWQASFLEQVCTSWLSVLSTTENLYIDQDPYSYFKWQDNIENTLWLDLLRPFTTMKNLYLSWDLVQRIGPALQELDEGRTTEVLPTLQNIFWEKDYSLEPGDPPQPVPEDIQQFVAMRQVAGHPIAVSSWEKDSTFF